MQQQCSCPMRAPFARQLHCISKLCGAHIKEQGCLCHAGPSCLPHGPGLIAAAVQLSNVGFFWEAPAYAAFAEVPWAVTANVMFKNTNNRYSLPEPHRTVPYVTIPYHTIPYRTIPYHTIPEPVLSPHMYPNGSIHIDNS